MDLKGSQSGSTAKELDFQAAFGITGKHQLVQLPFFG